MSRELDTISNDYDQPVLKIHDENLAVKSAATTSKSESVLEVKVMKKESFSERMKTHRFLMVRGIYYIFYSIWAIVMGIGMLIAWLIAMLFI